MFRVRLLRVGAAEHVLVVVLHHIVSDGWSTGVLVREFAALYEAYASRSVGEAASDAASSAVSAEVRGAGSSSAEQMQASGLAELAVQYADYAAWQRGWLQGEVLDEQLGYWRKQLGGLASGLELAGARARPAVARHVGAQQRYEVGAAEWRGVQALSGRAGVTPFMVLLAVFDVLLWRQTGQADIVVGTPIANRSRNELEGLIGFFTNTLVLRTDVSGNPTFLELVQRVREVCLGAYAHQDVPFEKLVEALEPERKLSRTPLFQVALVMQNTPLTEFRLSGLHVSAMPVESRTSKFDLTLRLSEGQEGWSFTLEYDTDLFDADTIARLAGHFRQLLSAIVACPDQRIGDLPLLTAAERQQLLTHWNDTRRAYPSQQGMHDLVGAQAARTPDAVAVVCGTDRLTYRDLNARANQVGPLSACARCGRGNARGGHAGTEHALSGGLARRAQSRWSVCPT